MIPDSVLTIGDKAPHFVLPSIQGAQVSLSDYQDRACVALWFSRGFTCNFCRRYMTQIIDQYDILQSYGLEVIQVAPNLLETSQAYFDDNPPPYPFICDPDKRLYAVYGLGDRGVLEASQNTVISFGTAFTQGEGIETVRASLTDVMNRNFLRRLHHHALTAVEQGIFVINKQGIIRYKLTTGPLKAIPSGEELLTIIRHACKG